MSAQDSSLRYSLRRSARAKNTRIVVRHDQIEVVAPLKVPEAKIKAFVASQQSWIEAALKRVAARVNHAPPSLAPTLYVDGARIPFQGQHYPLAITPDTGKTLKLEFQEQRLFAVSLPHSVAPELGSELIRQALTRWMKHQARQQASIFIAQHAPRHGLLPRSLRIKTQKSRWGSCGPHNDINLNWLLMLAPPAVMEYVVVHELCHISHKNHSAQFWQLVDEHMPDYAQHRRWLKQHGASVMRGL